MKSLISDRGYVARGGWLISHNLQQQAMISVTRLPIICNYPDSMLFNLQALAVTSAVFLLSYQHSPEDVGNPSPPRTSLHFIWTGNGDRYALLGVC